MRLEDIKLGDKLIADEGFTCLKGGEVVEIVQHDDGDLGFNCAGPDEGVNEGADYGKPVTDSRAEFHCLDGQENAEGEIVGLRLTQAPFSRALELILKGRRMARAGWNGKGMFVFLVPGSTFKVLSILGEGTEVRYHGHIDMKTADGQIVPWLASQSDLLDTDWESV